MPILGNWSEVTTLSTGNDGLDYNALSLVGRVCRRGRAADDDIVTHDGASIIPFPRFNVNHVYTTESCDLEKL